MTPEWSDPVIDEIREIRRQISARFDDDPARLVAHYMEQQERYRARLIDRSGPSARGDGPAAAPNPGIAGPTGGGGIDIGGGR